MKPSWELIETRAMVKNVNSNRSSLELHGKPAKITSQNCKLSKQFFLFNYFIVYFDTGRMKLNFS